MGRKPELFVVFQYNWRTTKTQKSPLKAITMELLEEIDRNNAILEACKKVGTSYSNAWKELNQFEEAIGGKVILRDGAHGSELTEFGSEFLRDYKEFRKRVQKDDFFKKYGRMLFKF